jgi:hypothetical protein
MPHTRILQIVYDAATRGAADPDFEPLDNAASARPDWYEYWPIRQFLAREALRDDTLYGFFSPRFGAKTRLSGREVHEFARAAGDVDVVTFSPHPDSSACFINVFEQGEYSVAGLLPAARLFLRGVAPAFDLDTFVTHSRNTVFSNYLLARPAFWRRWSELCGKLFAAAEPPPTPLHALLTRSHLFAMEGSERKPVQVKVFVMERLASVLIQQEHVSVAHYPPFTLPFSARFADSMPQLVELDRLKRAFCDTQDVAHLYDYAGKRNDLLRRVLGDGQGALPG